MTHQPPADGAKTGFAFGVVTTLFFAWGFVTSLIGPLIAALRRVFDLSYTEATLTTFAWFIAYGVASLPAAWALSKLGFSRAIIAALVVMVAGALIVPVATIVDWYPGVLAALFIIASGVTLLQVAANPLVAVLGSPRQSHFRLNFSQAFNSLGTVLGPLIGASILLTGGVFAADAVVTAATRAESLRAIDFAFLAVGAFFALVAVLIFLARKSIDAASARASEGGGVSPLKALKSPWAVFGALAIFFYVGSEVTIGDLMTNFLNSEGGLGVPIDQAGRMVSWYWGGAMVGRFIGALLLTRVRAGVLLSVCTAMAALMCLIVTQTTGPVAAYAAIGVGLFNSIMFPTIFTLTLERSGAPASATSGLLVFGIIGGAFLPLLGGSIADNLGSLNPAFYVPLAGYLILTAFAVMAARTKARHEVAGAAVGGH